MMLNNKPKTRIYLASILEYLLKAILLVMLISGIMLIISGMGIALNHKISFGVVLVSVTIIQLLKK